MKKAIILFLCTILLFSFTGCSPSGDSLNENSSTVTTPVYTEPVTEKPTVAPTEKPTEKPTEEPTEKPTEKPTQAPVSSTTASKYSASSSSYHYEAPPSSAEQQKNSMTVYITPSGKRYHYLSTCGGKNSYAVSIDDVGGRTPCKKCVH